MTPAFQRLGDLLILDSMILRIYKQPGLAGLFIIQD